MKLIYLIADSGGTKTDWWGMDTNYQTHRFETPSYHSVQLTPKFIETQKKYWATHDIDKCRLEFYGAGCLDKQQDKNMTDVLKNIGFENVVVKSDLELAARVIGQNYVTIAICGTGSTVFDVQTNEQISNIRGGLGWEHGDEGGGFYFGKLLLNRLNMNKEKYPDICRKIEQIRSLNKWLELQNTPESKYEYAQLSGLFAHQNNHPLIASVHTENCCLFFQKYVQDNNKEKELYLIGSYAFYLKGFFELVAKMYDTRIMNCIARPLETRIKKMPIDVL